MLPIPPGTDWRDAKPLILPGAVEAPALPAPKRSRAKKAAAIVAPVTPVPPRPVPTIGGGRLSFFEAPTPVMVAVPVEKPKREKKAKQKHDPRLVAAARELRDRYLEQHNAMPAIALAAKYEVGRTIEARAVALLPAA